MVGSWGSGGLWVAGDTSSRLTKPTDHQSHLKALNTRACKAWVTKKMAATGVGLSTRGQRDCASVECLDDQST